MRDAVVYIKQNLEPVFSANETQSLIRIITEYMTNKQYSPLLVDMHQLDKPEITKIEQIVSRLLQHEPIQQIIGQTEFYSLPLFVNKNVLIPRPETEELVELIIHENSPYRPLNILDIGTGSGAIAVALQKNIPGAQLEGWDISEKALEIAERNNELHQTNVLFRKIDVLNYQYSKNDKKYDVIVSNPPYVLESEKLEMEPNVLNFEPHLALFVPNNDPLLFYERIASLSLKLLSIRGKLYFEINRAKGQEIKEMLTSMKYKNIRVIKDMSKNDRIVTADRP